MSIARIKGFADMFPPESDAFTRVEQTGRDIFSRYGFVELRIPLLEFTNLFQRAIGEETDVVQKEMYTFPDRKGRLLTLRPEATAGVIRAYVESGLAGKEAVSRFFSYGPMFRYERPQKGRMRQFHQINCECLGSHSPFADAEIIGMLMHFLQALQLQDLQLKINSLGCSLCRPQFKKALLQYLQAVDTAMLCPDCLRRMESNPLRILDCKQPSCKQVVAAAPRRLDCNCPDCREHFDTVHRLLEQQHIPFAIDHNLVRGLDYYCRTTFEVVSSQIGAQTAVAGGGRYDGLVKSLGGPDVPGLGFACGMERIALLLAQDDFHPLDFYLVAPDNAGRIQGYALAQDLRRAGFCGKMNFSQSSWKSLMRQAGKSNARYCLIIGSDEVANNTVSVKNLESGEQTALPQSSVQHFLKTGTIHD
jgi:histidyl-tRNA synthetase